MPTADVGRRLIGRYPRPCWWRAATLPGELRILRNDRAVADAAMAALGELAERGDGYHRVPITDALIAAAAAVAVLHRDAHFERLAEVLAFECVELPVG